MKDFLKVVGLLLVILVSLCAIFWNKGVYGLHPIYRNKSCSGIVANQFVISHNFTTGKVSLTLFERTLLYSVDTSQSTSYCIGYSDKV